MNLQKASGDQNNASGFGKKSAIQPQREAWTDDLDLLPLSERKRILLYHDMPSKGLNGKQIIPDFNKEWPGLPKGVKFDPSDEELLWHLLAEIGKGVAKPHPFISEFIISLDEDDGLGNVHPQFLPGVKKDGSMSFFFHRKVGMYRSRQIKRQKKHDNSVEICWHRIGQSKAVCVDGIHQGSKEVLALYMNPVNGGNPVKTPWLMHQFHIGINGAKEDLVASKIFYEMRFKQDVQDSQTVSVEGCVSEVVSIAAPLQVASEFHEMLHVESVSAEASTQLFDTRLTPAELPIDELSQKVVDHDIGAETNVGHVGCLKLASSQKYPVTSFEKAIINLDQHSEGTLATDELPPLASSCEAAAEISISSTSAKSVKNQKERIVEKITDGFMRNLGDSGNIINNSNYDKVRDDGTCDANAAHVSLEKSCPERASEHDPQKNVVDKMFKTQGRFMATSSCEIKATDICSFTGHISRGKHEIESECLDEALISLGRTSSAEHFIAHENTIDDLFVLGLPTFTITGKISEETEPKNAFEKNSNNWVNISTHSALPIKLEPKSFEGTKMGIDSERSFNYRLNASAPSALFTKVKAESSEEANASVIFEKCVKKLPSFSQLSHPVNSSSTINFCFSKDSIEEKIIPHFYISKEGTPSCCNLSTQTCIPVGLNLPSTEILSATISGLDELSETTGMINQHPEKDDIVYDDLLMSKDNSQVIGDNECVNQSLYPQINYRTGEPQSNSVSSSSSLKVKSEPVETSLQACWQIPPCNTRGYISPMFENKTELPSDSFVDILDHVPLKYRLGISVSKGDENVKCGNNISEEIAPVTSGCRSFGSVNIKENLSSCRRRRKKTATDSLEKAMEEDAPGLLQVLLDRGIQVEEIKLYGDLEDNDPLETSSSEDSFEELEAVMTKLFSERSSLLRFTSGRPMKESRAVYCLACLISLIEQTRYLLFRQTPVEWGWCRDLQSFIFVFQTHNRIVLERPEYGFATYFFELVDSLPIDWQIKRLVKAMKLTNCSRTILLENKPLIVGEDLSEGEARVLEAYGWTPNTGFGTLLNYCDRVVHDRRNEMNNSEWRAKIGKLLMSGYDGGRIVLTNIPEKVVQHSGIRSSDIKMEL